MKIQHDSVTAPLFLLLQASWSLFYYHNAFMTATYRSPSMLALLLTLLASLLAIDEPLHTLPPHQKGHISCGSLRLRQVPSGMCSFAIAFLHSVNVFISNSSLPFTPIRQLLCYFCVTVTN